VQVTPDPRQRDVTIDASTKQAGLAAVLLNASQQVGGALGLAIFTAIATSHTHDRFAAHARPAEALTSGFQSALLASSIFLAASALIALRAPNTRGEPALSAVAEPEAVPDAA
jgi:hypothetical protein